MGLLRLEAEVEALAAPVLVAAFDGWIDAAGASTAATGLIASGGQSVATFDSDALYDYRSRRPVLDIVDGTLTELGWPELSITHRSIAGRDLLVLTGPEPDMRWRELGRDLLDFGLRLGVVEWVSLGSIPAAVPHTRPVPILATASKPGLLRPEEQQGPPGLLRVPSAALSTVELEVTGAGIPAVGFYAQVPHYVGSSFHAATIAILAHAGRHLGVEFPLGPLPDEAAAQRERLDAAIAQDDDLRAYLERLESEIGEEAIPSGDELAQEIERYLRGRGGEGPSRIGD
jgi:hypothetical protein